MFWGLEENSKERLIAKESNANISRNNKTAKSTSKNGKEKIRTKNWRDCTRNDLDIVKKGETETLLIAAQDNAINIQSKHC